MNAEIKDGKILVETPFGTLVAYASTDSDYPGIYIDLRRTGFGVDAPLMLTEYTETEADIEGGQLITRIWGNVAQEEYSDRIVHTGVADFFSTVDADGKREEYRGK